MKTAAIMTVLIAAIGASLAGQEQKPVPKDSVRVSIPGCSKGYVFTAARRTADQPGSTDVPEGAHLRMNGPKKLLTDIKAHEGAKIEITGIVKKSDFVPTGVSVGGVRIAPGPTPSSGGVSATPLGGQVFIDVESWRSVTGSCSSR